MLAAGFHALLAGREHRFPAAVDFGRSRLVLHHPDPDVLIAELDSAFVDAPPISLVQVFRFRDGLIAHLRDYFHPDVMG
jgi:hypothetical protein